MVRGPTHLASPLPTAPKTPPRQPVPKLPSSFSKSVSESNATACPPVLPRPLWEGSWTRTRVLHLHTAPSATRTPPFDGYSQSNQHASNKLPHVCSCMRMRGGIAFAIDADLACSSCGEGPQLWTPSISRCSSHCGFLHVPVLVAQRWCQHSFPSLVALGSRGEALPAPTACVGPSLLCVLATFDCEVLP